MKRPKILVVGSLVMDLIAETSRFPEAGETLLGDSFHTASGGKGANQAVQAARLGADTVMVGKLGMDSFGDEMQRSLEAAGVNTLHLTRTEEAPSAIGQIQIEKRDGHVQNRIIVVSGANMKLRPEDVAFLEAGISNFDMVLLQYEIPMAINEQVLGYAARAGVRVMVNPAPYAPTSDAVLRHAFCFSPNETEVGMMLGHAVNGTEEAEAACREMRRRGVSMPMITMGSQGAALLDGERFLFDPALRGLDVKDTTAAGDSFVASFCTAYSAGAGTAQALSFAKHAAGLTVCGMGAQPSLPAAARVFADLEARGHMTAELSELKGVLIS